MDTPLILAFDTSGAYCAAALLSGNTVLTQIYEEMTKGQAERLMGFLQEVLDKNGINYSDLSALAVGTGPGNFTGIRIGVSAARGLALGLDIPAYGIDGFQQRALLNPDSNIQCIPAPRDHFYVRDPDGTGMMEAETFDKKGYIAPPPYTADTLAASIARCACRLWPQEADAPAPYYVRAPDAAPSKIAPPVILT